MALDISKVFNRIMHADLLSKLPSFGLSVIYSLLNSFLNNRKIRVILDGSTSETFTINTGVPQGSGLGPTYIVSR